MALAIDASGPVIVQNTGASGVSTTASFTPPAGSRLWAFAGWDDSSSGVVTWSSSPVLTWHAIFDSNTAGGSSHGGWANVVTSQAYTVTATLSGATPFTGAALYVAVVTGGETTPGGAVQIASSFAAWLPSVALVATASNSIIIAAATGSAGGVTAWTYGNTPDAAPGPYAQAKLNGYINSGNIQAGYWRITPLTVAGRTYTPAATAGTTEGGNVGAVEIREPVSSHPNWGRVTI